MTGVSARGVVIAWVIVLGALLPGLARAQDAETELETQRERLEQLQQEIRQKKSEAARLGRRESSVVNELRQVERELEITRNLISTLEEQIGQSAFRIEDATRELARAQDALVIKRQLLARRLRSIYKLGKFGWFEVLLRSDSFADILARYKYLRLVGEQDRRLVDRIAGLEAQIRQNRTRLEAARSRLAEAHEARLDQARTLAESERDRGRMLEQVKSRRSEQLAAARQLEKETEKIQGVIATLERRRAEREELARREAEAAGREAPTPKASTLTGDFGSLDWPVQGEIIETFGRSRHPVYNTEVVNNGVDIKAPLGTPVKAVQAGEVAYADWNGGYGQMVIVDHDGGDYSLYAHLNRIDVAIGQRVAPGSVLGTVGETGSLVGPKLHFEIRKGRKPVDPIGWLRER